jgi:hypothetical protein
LPLEVRRERHAFQLQHELDILELAKQQRHRAVVAEAKAWDAEARAVQVATQVVEAEGKIARQRARAERFKTKAEKAKAKAARAKARAGFVINGRPWRITAPLSRLYSALKRAN